MRFESFCWSEEEEEMAVRGELDSKLTSVFHLPALKSSFLCLSAFRELYGSVKPLKPESKS